MAARELTTWQEIADYLGVSIRTAQNWEKESGLPVRRLPGRNRVLAFTAELDQWKLGPASPTAAPPPPGPPSIPLRLSIGAAIAAAIIVAAATLAARRPGPPFALRVDAHGFTVVDEAGRPLWRKTFPNRLNPLGSAEGFGHLLADLDRDGKDEILFLPQGEAESLTPLICYRSDGTEWWRFTPGRHVRTANYSFTNEYAACNALLLDNAGGARLAVGSLHRLYHPYQVAFLDAQGKLLRDYWHPGHMQAMALHDMDGDKRPELLLGGIDNARNQATVVAIDPAAANGASWRSNANYQFQGMPVVRERARLFFPRTCLNERHEPFNRAARIDATAQEVVVHVVERFVPVPATVFYHLAPDLTYKNAMFSSVYSRRHAGEARDHPIGEDARRMREIVRE